jgi:hypothetical protein
VIGTEALEPLVQEILRHTLEGRPALAQSLVDVVVEHGDTADLYGLCCAAADTAQTALLTLFPQAAAGKAGDRWQLPLGMAQDLAADPHRLFALRFVTAYLNQDTAMAVALFQAAEAAGGQDRLESVCALLAHVRALTQRAELGPADHAGGDPV